MVKAQDFDSCIVSSNLTIPAISKIKGKDSFPKRAKLNPRTLKDILDYFPQIKELIYVNYIIYKLLHKDNINGMEAII